METYFWDERIEYLKKSRAFMWNTDYAAFLVEKVWRINKPVDIVDFGCGLGFMGTLFLPLLPPGSTYTGIDKGGKLISEAKRRFEGAGDTVTFLQADILELQLPPRYDIAMCHTVLQHVTAPETLLKNMHGSVKDGGMVLCIEIDRNLANAGLYFDGLDYNSLNTLGTLQKLWSNDRQRDKTDHCIGTKLPAFLRRTGLRDVGVRISDYVQFVDPYGDLEAYRRNYEGLMDSGWRQPVRDKSEIIAALTERGLTPEEAAHQADAEAAIKEYLSVHADDACVVTSPYFIIAYGYK